jgi:hypothetical protein
MDLVKKYFLVNNVMYYTNKKSINIYSFVTKLVSRLLNIFLIHIFLIGKSYFSLNIHLFLDTYSHF